GREIRDFWVVGEDGEGEGTWWEKNLCLNTSVILRHVEKTYGAILSRSHMCRLLHNLGFVYKKPKHVPGKVDVEKQKNLWRNTVNSLKTRAKTRFFTSATVAIRSTTTFRRTAGFDVAWSVN
ncbi:MAG: winged helix-turn-helix domain-containing protein, partial [Planctomycetia bacterium]|nr:winged helix-turn-helix domain-containing protein [Planctomycetia bacterium]